MHVLNLQNYMAEGEEKEIDVKKELSEMLRMPGMYRNGIETCDGIILARSILGCDKETIEITDAELAILKKVMNILIERPHNPQMRQYSLGGKRYEEAILRVFLLDKDKDKDKE
jgi:hypothetical protein